MLLVVHIQVQVKPESIDAFKQATAKNATASLLEPGIARFDVAQSIDDPARFVFVEVYRDEDAPARHKETAHYLEWRDAVAGMMATPRTNAKYRSLFPDERGWASPAASSARAAGAR